MPIVEEINCADRAAARQACAAFIVERLAAALAGGSAPVGLIVSGGSNPAVVLPRVAAADLDWARVKMMAGDERLAPLDHPDSTERLCREAFARAGARATYLGLDGETDPERALALYRQDVDALPPAAVAFLGVGTDGHVASLFPGRPEGSDLTIRTAAAPETPPHKHPRVTLGWGALLEAAAICLIVDGPEKRAVYDAAMAGETPQLPISILLRQDRVPVRVFLA